MSSDQVKSQSMTLYEACHTQGLEKLLTQESLQDMKVIVPFNPDRLGECINYLLDHGLFKPMQLNGRPCWKAVSRENVKMYSGLSQDEALVLSTIDNAGRDGIWSKSIHSLTNLHSNTLTKVLKALENKEIIKKTHSARNPTHKTYILKTLQPSEELSGGPFYSDGGLDEEFIHYYCRWLENEIWKRSWVESSHRSNKRRKTHSGAGSSRSEDESSRPTEGDRYLPHPPGYTGYPTLKELAIGLNATGLANIKLKEAEVEQLLNLLRWDGKIERAMGGRGYKAVSRKGLDDRRPFSAMTETPCGRCPVFDLCDETGPVNAETCDYFPAWFEA